MLEGSQQPILQTSLDWGVSWHPWGWEQLSHFLKPRCLIADGTWGRGKGTFGCFTHGCCISMGILQFFSEHFWLLGAVLVSHGCCHKVPQTWWFKIPRIHIFTARKANSAAVGRVGTFRRLRGRVRASFQLLWRPFVFLGW